MRLFLRWFFDFSPPPKWPTVKWALNMFVRYGVAALGGAAMFIVVAGLIVIWRSLTL